MQRPAANLDFKNAAAVSQQMRNLSNFGQYQKVSELFWGKDGQAGSIKDNLKNYPPEQRQKILLSVMYAQFELYRRTGDYEQEAQLEQLDAVFSLLQEHQLSDELFEWNAKQPQELRQNLFLLVQLQEGLQQTSLPLATELAGRMRERLTSFYQKQFDGLVKDGITNPENSIEVIRSFLELGSQIQSSQYVFSANYQILLEQLKTKLKALSDDPKLAALQPQWQALLGQAH
jgi:hypothetical protein